MKLLMERLARQAGAISLSYREKLSSLAFEHKSAKDIVTEADKAVEAFLVEELQKAYPTHAILGEETGTHAGAAGADEAAENYLWVIDPIDGTCSYLHGQPFYAISIGLQCNGETILGAVYAPVFDDLYVAEKGKGATCNGEPISVSTRSELIESVLGTGFACVRADAEHNNIPYFSDILPRVRGMRRYGSASVDLCLVAAGIMDGFWELNLNAYDIAAGALIVAEAGGTISDFTGGTENLPGEIVATNGPLHPALIERLSTIRKTQRIPG